MSRHTIFDTTKLALKHLRHRRHIVTYEDMLQVHDVSQTRRNSDLCKVANRVVKAHRDDKPVILVAGAHVIKRGLSRLVIDLMERGILSHVCLNGGGMIHDFELALVGGTSENVSQSIRKGQFGLWNELGLLHAAIIEGHAKGLGLGEAVGAMIETSGFRFKEISILAAGYRLTIPVTVHVGIGYDIMFEHPNCDGSAIGGASYRDFLIFTHTVSMIEGGVFLNFGSAVMGPEIFLKALAMSRNVAMQEGSKLENFTTAVFDLVPLPRNCHVEPSQNDWRYYFRPLKTLLVRVVKDVGSSYYILGDHSETLPSLYLLIRRAEGI